MGKLTVGLLEDQLRRFDRETEISLTCGCCQCNSIGDILIEDNTDETGYVEISVNNLVMPSAELAIDKERFYEAEVKRLKKEKEEIKIEMFEYKDKLKCIEKFIRNEI